MRFPLTKVYRAFPELDRFSDAQCLAYIARARRKREVSRLLTGVCALVCCCVTGIGMSILAVWIADVVGSSVARPWILRNYLDVLYPPLAVLAVITVAYTSALLVRDQWLRWAVRKELIRSTCPFCEYQLLGLRPSNGTIICPECGKATPLDTLDLAAEELAMPGVPIE